MLPSEALQFEFSKQTRARGASYVQPQLIRLTEASPVSADAVVQGSEAYDVRIRRVDAGDGATEFVVACSCPYFQDQLDACKHVWAVLRFAEREGHLRGNGQPLARHNTFLALEGGDQPPRRTPRGQAFARPRPPDPSPASVFLANVSRQLLVRETEASEPPRFTDTTLLYVVDVFQHTDSSQAVVSVMHQRRTKQGAPGKPKVLKLRPRDIADASPLDRRLLAALAGAAWRDTYGYPYLSTDRERPATFQVPGPLAADLLPAMARTARAWLRTGPDQSLLEPLSWDDGNAWRFELRIRADGDQFTVGGELTRDAVTVPVTASVHPLPGGLIVVNRSMGRLEQAPANSFLVELRRTGPIRVAGEDVPALAEMIVRSGAVVPELPASLTVEAVRTTPTPRLAIRAEDVHRVDWFTGHLSFDYDGTIVRPTTLSPAVFDRERRRLVHRDRAAEQAAEARLLDAGFRSHWQFQGPALQLPRQLLSPVVRALVAEGWHVVADGVRYRTPTAVDLRVSSGIDWFDLHASVAFGEAAIPLTDILAALRPGTPGIRLGDGSVGILPEQWLEQYRDLVGSGEVEGDRIRFRRSQVALLDAMLATRATDASVRVDELFARARAELATFDRVQPLDPPASFTGRLRDYQREGLGWFAFLRQFGFGGCLADDMGLGKTVMVLALLDARRQAPVTDGAPRRPSLIVVPRSLVGNWLAEARAFAPGLRLMDHSHGQRVSGETTFAGADAVLVTYGTLRRDIAALSSVEFDYAVLDEAQTVKNATTAAAKAARLLSARHRLALSGTPIENHLGELWSLFEFLNPGVLGRSTSFRQLTAPDRMAPDQTALVAKGLRPFILRRTKQQVARELPERTEQTILCELHPKDRRLYDGLRRHYRTTLIDRIDREGLGKSRMHVLEALLRLRQVACHAGLVDPKRAADDSAKFDVLVPQLQEVVAEGHKALVFSQFTTLLGLLKQRLDGVKLPYEYLDGRTRDRAARVKRFQQDPSVPVFLVSLKAGGLGLNLTAAEYVFLLDPWWNPAVEAQAIDRAHRIGQTREVFAYRLIAKDTVEEKVLMLQQSKRDLADAVLAADAVGLRDLGRDDLLLLLS